MRCDYLKTQPQLFSLQRSLVTPKVAQRTSLVSSETQWQRALGNQALQSSSRTSAIQTKLAISQPGDPYEREADQIAEKIMRMPNEKFTDLSKSPRTVQKTCATCETEQKPCRKCSPGNKLNRKPRTSSHTSIIQRKHEESEEPPRSIQTVTDVVRGGGQALPESARTFFEPRFGYDFSEVRVHTGEAASASANSLNARAYTLGHNIVFGSGQFSPGTSSGNQLLAHELMHVVQQRRNDEVAVHRQTNTPTTPAAPAVNAAATSPHGRNCSQSHCAAEDRTVMGADLTRARGWVSNARQALATQPVSRRTGQLLDWYFNSQSTQTINTLNRRLECIQDSLVHAQSQRWWGCDPPYDANAYADMVAPVAFCAGQRDLICLTDNHFDNSPPRRSTTLIHEAAHLQGFSLGVLDNGTSFPDIYSWKPRFRELSTGESLQNADSVAYFCRAIATGVSPSFRFVLEAGAGFGATDDNTTWTARLFVGAEAEHPVLGLVSPRLGVGLTILGEPLESSPSPLSISNPGLIVSALAGVRLTDPRPGSAGTGFAVFEAGPSVIIDRSTRPGAELGVSVGYRWRMLEFSGRLGTILDPTNREGFRTAVIGTGGLGVNF